MTSPSAGARISLPRRRRDVDAAVGPSRLAVEEAPQAEGAADGAGERPLEPRRRRRLLARGLDLPEPRVLPPDPLHVHRRRIDLAAILDDQPLLGVAPRRDVERRAVVAPVGVGDRERLASPAACRAPMPTTARQRPSCSSTATRRPFHEAHGTPPSAGPMSTIAMPPGAASDSKGPTALAPSPEASASGDPAAAADPGVGEGGGGPPARGRTAAAPAREGRTRLAVAGEGSPVRRRRGRREPETTLGARRRREGRAGRPASRPADRSPGRPRERSWERDGDFGFIDELSAGRPRASDRRTAPWRRRPRRASGTG